MVKPKPMYRLIAGLAALSLVLVACGQHPGVHVEGDPVAGGVQQDDGMGEVAAPTETDEGPQVEVDEAGNGEGPQVDDAGQANDGGNGEAAAQATEQTGNGGEATDGGGNGDGNGDEGGAQGQQQPQGQDRTGVSDDTIRFATHAPVTGAAPLPSASFEQAADLYWRWLFEEKNETVLGRTNIEQTFADDRYEPATARQICRELAQDHFLLYGGGGTDQIQACGQLAAQMRVPYMSPGVTEVGLEGNPWYFANSMTYRQQGALLAEFVRAEFGDRPVGMIATQTPNFDDAVAGWEQGVAEHGLDHRATLRHPRGQTGWYANMANDLADQGVEVLYILTSPLDYIRFAQVADEQDIDFQYVGVGITKGLNAVLGSGCPEVDGGIFFSPFPALETAKDLDPEFLQAAERFGAPADDIAWAIWGSAKGMHSMLERYGEIYGDDLTREDFRAMLESTGPFESGVFNPIDYTPDNHFGGQGVHVLQADCSIEEHRDRGTFKSGF
jgi:ABC-type branched-subunit amino acid transport system substrate-binding protein